MNGRDFYPLAVQLAGGSTEAAWRTAVSRAYYAAFHVARDLFEGLGFRVPHADLAHKYLVYRLSNCGDSPVQGAGALLDALRGYRNQADYEMAVALAQPFALQQVRKADQIIQILDAIQEPRRTQITDAMKIYERDVLKNVTWHP
jgi:uncharacterized protein (UPF0332 family)